MRSKDGDGYVLVVEDERDIREPLVELLVESGYDTKVAADGQEALDVLRKSSLPRLILLDLLMPVMDGAEFLRRKGREPSLSAIPVCLVTAVPPTGPLGPSVVSLIPKPIDANALISVLDRYC